MLKFFYTSKYHEPADESEELRPRLEMQILTYNLADKYDVPDLMELVGKRFKSTLGTKIPPEEYFPLVLLLYTLPTPTDALKNIVVEYARVNFRDILHSPDLESMRTTILDLPEFAFDVLQLFANAPLRGHCYSCGSMQAAEALQARCVKCRKGGISLSA